MDLPTPAPAAGKGTPEGLFAGPGPMRALCRAHDWDSTPLGPVSGWDQGLRATVRTLLTSRYPMILIWGEDFIQIYNDAYAVVIGDKHPAALGIDIRVTLAEAWSTLGPMIAEVMRTGEANWVPAQQLLLDRSGYAEEAYFSLSHAPAEDDAGRVAGMLCVCSEVTQQVVGDRRLRLLRRVAERAGGTLDAAQTCAAVAEALESAPDVPFAVIRLREGDDLCLAASSGLGGQRPLATRLAPGEAPDWIARASRGETVVFATDGLDSRFHGGPWGHRVTQGIAMPLPGAPGQPPLGVLVAGLNPNRALDEDYRTFFSLLVGGIANAVRNARAYEEERARAEALAELDRAKTHFFSNVSHEFRTPLTLMLGPLEDLLALPPERLAAKREELAVIHRNGLRLLKLVNALLDFSRVEAGRTSARFVPTDIATTTEQLASTFRSAIERAGLSLTVRTKPTGPVLLDRDMWEKIVLNLLSNALKHTPQGSIAVTLAPRDGAVELEVADTGIGIAPEQLPHVFERFHRIEGAWSRSHEGSGIGLALVRDLARLHGGEVTAESSPGAGTTFRVRLPATGADASPPPAATDAAPTATPGDAFVQEALQWLPEAPPATPAAAGAPGRPTILLADDNADMRAYVERLLAPHYTVLAARDGEEAFRLALAREPDLVLTDVMMPRVDGFELLRRLRAEPTLRGLPVIMLSARAGEEAKVQGLEASADDYLVKPFVAAELLARVRVTLELSRMRRELAEARHQAGKMDALGQLTGGVAHDFNNLLMAISGGLAVAIRRTQDEGVLRVLRNASIAAERGAALTKQLLAFARRAPLAARPVDVNALIARMSELLHRTLGGRITVVTRLAGDLRPVLADETQLELALLNLAVNARDAMPEGGELTLATADLPAEARPPHLAAGDYVAITVSDTGHGMAADVAERAFEPFFSTKPVGRGTGLGLSQVFGVMRALGGSARLDSAPGQGTVVSLLLRASPTRAGEGAAAEPGNLANAPARILLVDDDPLVRRAAAEMLRELGHEVEEAESGADALHRLSRAREPFNLLLTDFAMAGMNGAELAAAAREAHPGLPVILATGYASPGALDAERARGLVVEKPFRMGELADAIRNVTG